MCLDTSTCALGGQSVTGLHHLASELAITIADPQVWLALALALLLGGACWLFGTWVARTAGLLRSDAPAGETLGVGLASGLMVFAAWWATFWSGGRSSFTPVAIGFAVALAISLLRKVRHGGRSGEHASVSTRDASGVASTRSVRRPLPVAALVGALFVAGVGLLYGATMAPSPRIGVQPMEYADEAYYAVLGRDLAATGIETNLSPSGFDAPGLSDLSGLPAQQWYHWGELWLAAAVISVFGVGPLAARYFVVLPLLVLAASALTGTLVCRVTGASSRRAYTFGFLACLFLAPVPLTGGPLFASWSAGLLFGITEYGLSAVAVLLALYLLAVVPTRPPGWALASFSGSAVAFIFPAHIAIALLAIIGAAGVWAYHIGQSLISRRRFPTVSPTWRRALIAAGGALAATLVWGTLTGHGVAGGGMSSRVAEFGQIWILAMVVTVIGAGVFYAIPIAWAHERRRAVSWVDVYLGCMVLVVVGAIAWGARLGDYTTYYLFFGGIAIFATPLAAVAAWWLVRKLAGLRNSGLALAMVGLLLVLQLSLGAAATVVRLQQVGPRLGQEAVPVSLLTEIAQLPADAKLAYACRSLAEVSFVDTRLLSIDAHTGHRVIPLCFQADVFGVLDGAPVSLETPAVGFSSTPQHALFPDAAADPSSAAVTTFLKDHGIDYIYADAAHPNSLIADAVPIATSGDFEVLRVP